jgi:Lrp/AsnC family leucine-responsive transcriptional regulator
VLSRLSRVSGIRQHSLSLGLRVFKYSTRVGPITPKQRRPLSLPDNPMIDAVDRGIIERVWADARATNQSIAERLSLSEASVRARINGLIKRNILRITCMRGVSVDERHVFAFLGLEVGGADIVEVAEQLARSPTTGFVGIVLGRYQIFATMLVSSPAELADFIANRVEPLRGVRKVHLTHAVKFLKYDDRWTLIVPGESPAAFPGGETGGIKG